MPDVVEIPSDDATDGEQAYAASLARSTVAIHWFETRVGTRVAAFLWWLVMTFFTLLIMSWWIALASDPSWVPAAILGAVTVIMGLPLVREATNAKRMGRMLTRGT